MRDLDLHGPISDEKLEIISNSAIVVEGNKIFDFGDFNEMHKKYPDAEIEKISGDAVALPGFIDAHTHICFAGNRAMDYAMRLQGKSYLEIAKEGGGISSSVQATRAASLDELTKLTVTRANHHLKNGTTTIEVKSGYGLSVAEEIKILQAIKKANENCAADLIPTCLAAHIKPKDFQGSNTNYLEQIVDELFPILKKENLTNRIDIFVEEGAFSVDEARKYLYEAKKQNFDITVHADQFSVGGMALAVEVQALSADHLEASADKEISLIANSNTVAVALPGASYGLGIYNFTQARKLLDAGAILAIASDHNPGSAPMGELLTQAAIFGMNQKLSNAETFAAITFRAAKALNLNDRGVIAKNKLADFQIYPCADYRQILYHQGSMRLVKIYKGGKDVSRS